MPDWQSLLLDWFDRHGRKLPWRRTYDPYHVWISEVMLQQTQVERVIDYFDRWLDRFPEVKSVAAASEDEVLRLWEGLGYYSRARNVRRCAEVLVNDFDCRLPDDHASLLALPGIGRYTAGAIMSLAFNRDYPIVDANIERVFARLFDLDAPVKAPESQRRIWQEAETAIPPGRARFFNQAMMELGALVCLPRQPRCGECPVGAHCEAHRLGIVEERPVPGKGKNIVPIASANGILVHEGRLFIQKRRAHGVWANLWEFPGGQVEPGESPEEAVAREFFEETELELDALEKIGEIRHGYTTYRITLHYFLCAPASATEPALHAAQEYRWVTPAELDAYPFPAPHRKLIDLLRGDPRLQARLSGWPLSASQEEEARSTILSTRF